MNDITTDRDRDYLKRDRISAHMNARLQSGVKSTSTGSFTHLPDLLENTLKQINFASQKKDNLLSPKPLATTAASSQKPILPATTFNNHTISSLQDSLTNSASDQKRQEQQRSDKQQHTQRHYGQRQTAVVNSRITLPKTLSHTIQSWNQVALLNSAANITTVNPQQATLAFKTLNALPDDHFIKALQIIHPSFLAAMSQALPNSSQIHLQQRLLKVQAQLPQAPTQHNRQNSSTTTTHDLLYQLTNIVNPNKQLAHLQHQSMALQTKFALEQPKSLASILNFLSKTNAERYIRHLPPEARSLLLANHSQLQRFSPSQKQQLSMATQTLWSTHTKKPHTDSLTHTHPKEIATAFVSLSLTEQTKYLTQLQHNNPQLLSQFAQKNPQLFLNTIQNSDKEDRKTTLNALDNDTKFELTMEILEAPQYSADLLEELLMTSDQTKKELSETSDDGAAVQIERIQLREQILTKLIDAKLQEQVESQLISQADLLNTVNGVMTSLQQLSVGDSQLQLLNDIKPQLKHAVIQKSPESVLKALEQSDLVGSQSFIQSLPDQNVALLTKVAEHSEHTSTQLMMVLQTTEKNPPISSINAVAPTTVEGINQQLIHLKSIKQQLDLIKSLPNDLQAKWIQQEPQLLNHLMSSLPDSSTPYPLQLPTAITELDAWLQQITSHTDKLALLQLVDPELQSHYIIEHSDTVLSWLKDTTNQQVIQFIKQLSVESQRHLLPLTESLMTLKTTTDISPPASFEQQEAFSPVTTTDTSVGAESQDITDLSEAMKTLETEVSKEKVDTHQDSLVQKTDALYTPVGQTTQAEVADFNLAQEQESQHTLKMQFEQLAKQLVQKISLLKTGFHTQDTTLALQLKDSVFKGMEIYVTKTADGLHIQLLTQDASVQAFMNQRMTTLKKYLEERLELTEDAIDIELTTELAGTQGIQVDQNSSETLFQNKQTSTLAHVPMTPMWLSGGG